MKEACDRLPGGAGVTQSPTTSIGLVASLYLMEASGLMALLAVYRNGDKPLNMLVTGKDRPFFLAGLLGVLVCSVYLVTRYRRTFIGQRRKFWLTVAMNIATVALAFLTGEATVRLLTSSTPLGPVVLNTPLLPRSWDAAVARNRELLERAPSNISYFVPDGSLGWTVGPSRQSKDGLYFSSSEGIRSAGPNVSYATRSVMHRVATVGDSFTFGLEVRFEDSWAARLEQLLGSQVQVLNFGVDGYGVDQAYLRYSRDVRQWHPELVLLGFIRHDLYRSLVVYSFVAFPEGFPFAKPRFVVDAGMLRLLNVPLPSPQEILSRRTIADLPFVEFDPGYDPGEWDWHAYHRSRLIRLVLSRFRRWPDQNVRATDQVATFLNGEIITSFARLAEREGTRPLVVFFPARSDFGATDRRVWNGVVTTLRARGIDYVDLTPCVSELGVSELFIQGRPHYSPKGNARVATCLHSLVRDRLFR